MYKIDDEFKNLIPELSDEEFERLKESILEDGLRDPIITWNGTIIDGHNRYRICTENNIPIKNTEKEFKSKNDALIWIAINQFGRRNLNTFQKSELALKIKPLIKAKANENLKTSTGGVNPQPSTILKKVEKIDTTAELAKIVGVGYVTMSKAIKIDKEASEEIKEKLRKKEMSISKAYEEITKKDEPEEDGEEIKYTCNVCHGKYPIHEMVKGSKTRCRPCASFISSERKKGNKVDVKALSEVKVDFEKLFAEMKKGHAPKKSVPNTQPVPIITELIEELNTFHIKANKFTLFPDLCKYKNQEQLVKAINMAYEDIKKIKNNLEVGNEEYSTNV